ncbi:MAG: hypothetical protein H6868_05675 [Rhodospirillales bacterium]|nr:hypothetical protein [Rhodospirillales bacterium]
MATANDDMKDRLEVDLAEQKQPGIHKAAQAAPEASPEEDVRRKPEQLSFDYTNEPDPIKRILDALTKAIHPQEIVHTESSRGYLPWAAAHLKPQANFSTLKDGQPVRFTHTVENTKGVSEDRHYDVTHDKITFTDNNALFEASDAFEMAWIASFDPDMHANPVTLEGNEREKALLYLAIDHMGLEATLPLPKEIIENYRAEWDAFLNGPKAPQFDASYAKGGPITCPDYLAMAKKPVAAPPAPEAADATEDISLDIPGEDVAPKSDISQKTRQILSEYLAPEELYRQARHDIENREPGTVTIDDIKGLGDTPVQTWQAQGVLKALTAEGLLDTQKDGHQTIYSKPAPSDATPELAQIPLLPPEVTEEAAGEIIVSEDIASAEAENAPEALKNDRPDVILLGQDAPKQQLVGPATAHNDDSFTDLPHGLSRAAWDDVIRSDAGKKPSSKPVVVEGRSERVIEDVAVEAQAAPQTSPLPAPQDVSAIEDAEFREIPADEAPRKNTVEPEPLLTREELDSIRAEFASAEAPESDEPIKTPEQKAEEYIREKTNLTVEHYRRLSAMVAEDISRGAIDGPVVFPRDIAKPQKYREQGVGVGRANHILHAMGIEGRVIEPLEGDSKTYLIVDGDALELSVAGEPQKKPAAPLKLTEDDVIDSQRPVSENQYRKIKQTFAGSAEKTTGLRLRACVEEHELEEHETRYVLGRLKQDGLVPKV